MGFGAREQYGRGGFALCPARARRGAAKPVNPWRCDYLSLQDGVAAGIASPYKNSVDGGRSAAAREKRKAFATPSSDRQKARNRARPERERMMKKLIAAASAFLCLTAASAQAGLTPGGVSLQEANSAVAEDVHFFHNAVLMPIITFICVFVLALLIWVMVRYNRGANATPKKFSHNTLVEIVWTGVPILILLVIALPSFELLFKQDITPDGKQTVIAADGSAREFAFANDFPERRMVENRRHLEVLVASEAETRRLRYNADYTVEGFGEPEIRVALNEAPDAGARVIIRGGQSSQNASGCGFFGRYFDLCEKEIVMAPTMTLKVNGYQWNWQYYYPDFGNFDFFSNMLAEDAASEELYRLEVDNRVVVPVGETIRVITTANDVIHAWAMPAFALKIDAVPGRINETWFKAEREGVFYGQCSEICGVKHAFMPIAVEVVSRPEFEAWVDEQRAFAGMDPMFTNNDVKLAQGDRAETVVLD